MGDQGSYESQSESLREVLAPAVASLLMEGTAYGLYFSLFCASLHALSYSMKDATNKRVLSRISVALFVLISSHWIFRSWSVFTGIYNLLGITDTYDKYYQPKVIVSSVLYIAPTILADGVFTYRLFIIWGRKWWVIVLPVTAMFISPVLFIISMCLPFFRVDGALASLLMQLAVTWATNVYITAMISIKIWRHNRANRQVLGRPLGLPGLSSVLRVLLESTGLYTTFITIAILGPIIATAMNAGQATVFAFAFVELLAPIVGINYSLMIVLVAGGRTSEPPRLEKISTLVFRGNLAPHPPDSESQDASDDAMELEELGSHSDIVTISRRQSTDEFPSVGRERCP